MRSTKRIALASILVMASSILISAEGHVVILDYHTFLGNSKSNLDYSEKELGDELDEIAAMGFKFVSLDDAIAGRISGDENIVVTIDDGNHTIYQAFKDVFEPRGIKPYLFIYPAIVRGHVRYALTPERIMLLSESGCGIGAHGYHHNPVTDKAWVKDPKDFMTEINKPGPALAAITGQAPTMFAYPFGVYSKRAEDAIASAGYAWGFAADDKVTPVDFSDTSLDRMAVPRTITYRYLRKSLLAELARIAEAGSPPSFELPVPAPAYGPEAPAANSQAASIGSEAAPSKVATP